MSDSLREINWLRYWHQSEDAMKDKDILKDEAHIALKNKINGLYALPLAFQLWQLSLCNHAEKSALYKQVRVLKTLAFFGATAAATYEYLNLRRQWTYIDRFYPEPTELQKGLTRDAMIYKENNYKQKSTEERFQVANDTQTNRNYAAMY